MFRRIALVATLALSGLTGCVAVPYEEGGYGYAQPSYAAPVYAPPVVIAPSYSYGPSYRPYHHHRPYGGWGRRW